MKSFTLAANPTEIPVYSINNISVAQRSTQNPMKKETTMKHIKWVIAHEPIGLFLKVAERFANEVNEKTNGLFNIEVLSLSDYAEKYNDGKAITKYDLMDLINSGAIEMSHIYTTWLGDYNQDLHALDLPFIFKDHDHADRQRAVEVSEREALWSVPGRGLQGSLCPDSLCHLRVFLFKAPSLGY